MLVELPFLVQVCGMPLTVAVGSVISVEGFTFMMSPAAAGSVRKALIGQGAIPMGSSAWESLRILRGYKPYLIALFGICIGPCLFWIACNYLNYVYEVLLFYGVYWPCLVE